MKTNMKRAAFVVALVVVAIGVGGSFMLPRAEASPVSQLAAQTSAVTLGATPRPAAELALLQLLNGEPQLGTQVTTATGSDVTMTVTSGRPWVISCTTDSVMLPGSTVSTTTGQTVFAGANTYVLTSTNTTTLAFRAKASAGLCNGNELK